MKIEITATGAACRNLSITDRVKTFEDACQVLGIKGTVANIELHDSLDEDAEAIGALTKLVIITKALNEGWKPNWNNSNEYKRYPYFDMRNGFSFDSVSYHSRYSRVSSRLCFRTEALAQHAVKQFPDLYKKLFTY